MALIGVDWGTTNLQAYLFSEAGVVIESLEQENGGVLPVISGAGVSGGNARASLVLTLQGLLSRGASASWRDQQTPVLLCGMVGSRMGFDVSCVETPAAAASFGSAAKAVCVLPNRYIWIVPGLSHSMPMGSDAPDILRGEETQLLGALSLHAEASATKRLFVLPGTHSKWAWVASGTVEAFCTRMAGEVFDVLAAHSILGQHMARETGHVEEDLEWFTVGLQRSGTKGGLLAHLFSCHTEGLAGTISSQNLLPYLSGILIGHEVRDALKDVRIDFPVIIVGKPSLCKKYRRAFALIWKTEAQVIPGEEAVSRGLWRVWQELDRRRATAKARLEDALRVCPIVAILRGIEPSYVVVVGEALFAAGIRILEVPLNSPDALRSITILSERFAGEAVIGAGTVLSEQEVEAVAQVGGVLIVSPNLDEVVVRKTKEMGLLSVPGVFTPSEAFAAIKMGADILKVFPGDCVPPKIIKTWRAVLPKDVDLCITGGVTSSNIVEYWEVGASAFGIASSIFQPGESADTVRRKADVLVAACRSLEPATSSKRQRLS